MRPAGRQNGGCGRGERDHGPRAPTRRACCTYETLGAVTWNQAGVGNRANNESSYFPRSDDGSIIAEPLEDRLGLGNRLGSSGFAYTQPGARRFSDPPGQPDRRALFPSNRISGQGRMKIREYLRKALPFRSIYRPPNPPQGMGNCGFWGPRRGFRPCSNRGSKPLSSPRSHRAPSHSRRGRRPGGRSPGGWSGGPAG